VGVVSAAAVFKQHPLVVLQEVQLVVTDDAAQFAKAPPLGAGAGEAHAFPGEIGRLPILREVVREPRAHIGFVNRKSFRSLGCTALGPSNPQSELKPFGFGVFSDGLEAVWELLQIGVPIANGAVPTGIHVKQLQAQVRGIVNHANSEGFIDSHAASPTIVDQKRVATVAHWRADVALHVAVEAVCTVVNASGVSTDKYRGSCEGFSAEQSSAEREVAGVQSRRKYDAVGVFNPRIYSG
jgi:hypothetical protein